MSTAPLDATSPLDAVRADQAASSDLSRYLRQHLADLESLPTYRPVIGCVIPAYNEAGSIEAVLRSLLEQTRQPDEIHVVVNNTKDDTFELAAKFAGPRTAKKKRKGEAVKQTTEVFVHDIGENPDKKVGALNYGFGLIGNADYLLGVDGDTTLAPDTGEAAGRARVGLPHRWDLGDLHDRRLRLQGSGQAVPDRRSASPVRGVQHADHAPRPEHGGARWAVLDLLDEGTPYVMKANHQATPWVNDSEVEDSPLSLQIKSAGYLTKISAQARASVGGMTTIRTVSR